MRFLYLVTVFPLFLFQAAAALTGSSFAVSQENGLEKRDAAPVAGADGICFTYTVQQGDTCAKVADSHSVSTSDIDKWNTGSWAWRGCTNIMQGDFVCLSPGVLPMPIALPNAVCGPQMPGSMRPQNYADLASLNPCPSAQCCSRWFQCGTSSAFCSPDEGCLSNCGVEAVTKQTTSSKETTTSKSTTSQKSSTTSTSTKVEVTTVTSVTVVQPVATWAITLYEDKGCDDGNYFSLQGHEKNGQGQCLNLKDHTDTTISDDTLSCRWWTKEGLEWSTCSSSKVTKPKSWYLKAGACWVYTDDKCETYGGRIDRKGCGYPNTSYWAPDEFVSIKCWAN